MNSHYADAHLPQRLREALEAEGLNPHQLTLDDLAPLDQLHVGGRRATRQLIEAVGLSAPAQVLDLGCGTGGSSRLLAHEYGCQTLGVDITPEFIQVAEQLTAATGLASSCSFVCADAAHLPLAEASFDYVLCQHSLLNMPDLTPVLAEIHRLLKPGGQLLLHEVVQGENTEPLLLPVPWARQAEQSHLLTPEALYQRLLQAGLVQDYHQDISAAATAWRSKHTQREARGQAGILTPQLIFGADFVQMGRNLAENLRSGRVRLIAAAWHRP